ncbi:ABC transporter ATP-binding protein/permease [Flavobacteriales bacterium]|nr:ABC transporter ATP-binding protein/permease [Flavobacteriales bacterium]
MNDLKYLIKYYKKYRYRFFIGVFFVVVSNIFALYPAKYTRMAFDKAKEAISSQDQIAANIDYNELTQTLIYFGVMVILFAVLKGVFMFFMRQTIIVMSRMIEFDLKNEIYSHYQKLDLSFYKKNNTGDLMSRISEDVSRVRMFLGPATMYPINIISLFSLIVYTMLSINVKLTLFVLAPLPIMSISIFYISKVIHQKSERVQIQLSKLSTFSQETFSGIRIIKSFTNEKSNSEYFEAETKNYLKENVSLARTNALFFPFMLLLIGLSTLLTIYIGGKEAIAGNITTGNIAEFIIYVNMLTWPMASIGWVTSIIQRADASQKRINEFLKTEPEIVNQNNSHSIIKGKVRFDNVSYTYPDTAIKAINKVSFELNLGKTLAIVGKTGSGKSTVAQLINRLIIPTQGNILIDEQKIESLNLYDLRNNIGFVPQESILFSDTISNNIAFGLKENDDFELIKEAAQKANVHENILKFPKQYETKVGERGVTLSGGQKQRISIARALIKNPQILIFDDCLSAVDTKTEDSILSSIKSESKNKTSIIISHRISTIKHADQIIVLEKGTIAEQGTHEELIEQNGIYFEMTSQQSI